MRRIQGTLGKHVQAVRRMRVAWSASLDAVERGPFSPDAGHPSTINLAIKARKKKGFTW
jgi:hypothetical protein